MTSLAFARFILFPIILSISTTWGTPNDCRGAFSSNSLFSNLSSRLQSFSQNRQKFSAARFFDRTDDPPNVWESILIQVGGSPLDPEAPVEELIVLGKLAGVRGLFSPQYIAMFYVDPKGDHKYYRFTLGRGYKLAKSFSDLRKLFPVNTAVSASDINDSQWAQLLRSLALLKEHLQSL